MIRLCDSNTCTGCSACYASCMHGALSMVRDDEGFLQPKIDVDKCVECGMCVRSCPILTPLNSSNVKIEKIYAIENKDGIERRNAASGGFYSIIAKYFINEYHGIACGAVFDNNFHVIHEAIDDASQISRFASSKYVQSEMNDTFKEIKKILKSGRQVVFSGVPCQVAGLLNFLKRKYDNLITVELVCHGVPSPGFWKKYLDYQCQHYGSNITTVNFKDKRLGYGSPSMKLTFSNGRIHYGDSNTDIMLKGFFGGFISRNSCFNCKFRGQNHFADITILDGWHISKWNMKMNDDKGTTLVMLHNNKAINIFEKIKEKLLYQEVDIDDPFARKDAVMYYELTPKSKSRDAFLKEVSSLGFKNTVDKYMHITLQARLKYLLKSILHTIGIFKIINKYKRLL